MGTLGIATGAASAAVAFSTTAFVKGAMAGAAAVAQEGQQQHLPQGLLDQPRPAYLPPPLPSGGDGIGFASAGTWAIPLVLTLWLTQHQMQQENLRLHKRMICKLHCCLPKQDHQIRQFALHVSLRITAKGFLTCIVGLAQQLSCSWRQRK